MELRGGAELVDGLIEEPQGVAERVREVVWWIEEGGGAWEQDTQVDLGAEEGDAEAEAGEGGAVSPGNSLDEPVQTKASEIVGHRAA